MKSFFCTLLVALIGLVGGLVLPRPDILEKHLPPQLKRYPALAGAEKLPNRWDYALPQGFDVDEGRVKEDLIGKKLWIRGDKTWFVSKSVRVEILNKRSVYDDKVEVFIELTDLHRMNLLKSEKLSGMVRISYDMVVRKSDGKRLWYVEGVNDLSLKIEEKRDVGPAPPQKLPKTVEHPEKLPDPEPEKK